jgi:hypothetical protein
MPIYQFLLLITPDKITVVCSQKKADIIETLKQGDKQIALEVIRRGKNGEENVPLYENIVKQLNNVGFFFCFTIRLFTHKRIPCRKKWVFLSKINSKARILMNGKRLAPNIIKIMKKWIYLLLFLLVWPRKMKKKW